jgi:gliding motility-associated-like protein
MKPTHFLFLIFGFVWTGCFKENPQQLPQYIAKQNLDVAVDSSICYSGYEDFAAYQLSCSLPNDSVHWYYNYQSPTPVFLGNDNPLSLPVPTAGGGHSIQCLRFVDGDTLYDWLAFMYCGRSIYIPRAFSPRYNDGVNDRWQPIAYNGTGLLNYSIYWEIRTMDGIQMYVASNAQQYWDGTYNGNIVPLGTYFFYILLEYDGEEPLEYTGIVEVLE